MSLRRAIILLILAGLMTPALISSFFEYNNSLDDAHKDLKNDLNRTLDFLSFGLEEVMWAFDKAGAEPLLASAMRDQRVIRVTVTETGGTLFLETMDQKRHLGKTYTEYRQVTRRGVVIGLVTVELDETLNIEQADKRQIVNFLKIGLQLLFSLFLILLFLNKRVLNPIKRLEDQSLRLASHQLEGPFLWKRADELGRLGRSLEATRKSLLNVFNALESKNAELELDIQARIETEKELLLYKVHLEDIVENRTKELVASNRELESFSYYVSHDLRAPLRSVDGFSQALLEDYGQKLDETAKDYISRMRNAIQRMSILIDDLLDLARITRSPLVRTETNLASLAEAIVRELKEREPERTVDFETRGDFIVSADPNLMRIALLNLLDNAFKYTSKKESTVIVLHEHFENVKRIFTISDNGVGFEMEYAHKLFTAFNRLHDSAQFPGNGVGLAIVQRVILRHGGEIWGRSEPGNGAEFSFTLGTDT